jgi:putative hydrolase of the HAD superfamily
MLDWQAIDTVLLDMDGTLLDLHFDNHFWLEHLPLRYAELKQLDPQAARDQLYARYRAVQGTLDWYCIDYWRSALEVDIVALKREVDHLIEVHPHVPEFLDRLRLHGKQVVLVTNAHQASLELKMEQTRLGGHFDHIVSVHEFGYPKEDPRCWETLQAQEPFEKPRTLLIDDNLDVLRSAREFGIGHLLAVYQPDSRGPRRDTGEFDAVESFADLMPAPLQAAPASGPTT